MPYPPSGINTEDEEEEEEDSRREDKEFWTE
jgi:hypothetical protein